MAMYVNGLEAARDFFVQHFGGRANDGCRNRTSSFRSCFIFSDDGASCAKLINSAAGRSTTFGRFTGKKAANEIYDLYNYNGAMAVLL